MTIKNEFMTTHYSLRIITLKGILFSILIFCSSFVYSQSALNILDLNHELFSEKKVLTITTLARIGDYSFHSNIGGVSFQEVAYPGSSVKNEKISLDFINNRMVINVGKRTFYSDLPFWQLVPIINFAHSPYNVALTLYGDTVGKRGPQCRYHPAFLDNLLGLRLLQADLLNMPEIMWDLPVDDHLQYIMASSEKAYVPQKDSTLYRKIYDKLVNAGFTSFVLTDYNTDIVFDADEYGLVFSGKPYYFFTKAKVDTSNFQSLRKQVFACYDEIEIHAKIILKGGYSSALNPRTNLGDLLTALNKNKAERIFNPYSMYYIENALSKLDSLNKLTDAQIGIQFQILDAYTKSFRPYWDLLKQYNPAVYSAVENTMCWSAFFRYIRKVNPDNWSNFVKQVEANGKWDAPIVKTPTSFEINYIRYFYEKEKNEKKM